MRRAWARFAQTSALTSSLLLAAGLSTAFAQPPGAPTEEQAGGEERAEAPGAGGAPSESGEEPTADDAPAPDERARSTDEAGPNGSLDGADDGGDADEGDDAPDDGSRAAVTSDERGAEDGSGSEDGSGDAVAPSAGDQPGAQSAPPSSAGSIRYVLERIDVRSDGDTGRSVILGYIPLRIGEVLDVEDPRIESIRWRLLGTGWFNDVQLRLERGTQRGHVVLVVEVREHNTFVVQSLALGFSEGLVHTRDPNARLDPYFGISVAELNLFGTGVGLELTGLLSVGQQGVRLRSGVASVGGSEWGLTGTVFFNNGREFFGNDDVIVAVDECPPDGAMRCEEGRNAVVSYRRYGASLGTGHDLTPNLRFTLDYQLEAVDVVDRPDAASHRRGAEIVPIDFAIHDGLSWISSLQLGLTHDERDNPALPADGRFVFVRADLSTTLIGSSYDFVRVQAGWREWFRLPDAHHTLRLGLFIGGAVGDVPFFYKFYASDLSDLIPSRVLQLNLDRRAPPNLFGTAVGEMRAQELAGRFDVEYAIWVYEGGDGLRGIQLYGLVGLYALMDRQDLRVAIPGYAGPARAPIDFTFDVGLRFDTVVGVFELGFSTLLGFVSL